MLAGNLNSSWIPKPDLKKKQILAWNPNFTPWPRLETQTWHATSDLKTDSWLQTSIWNLNPGLKPYIWLHAQISEPNLSLKLQFEPLLGVKVWNVAFVCQLFVENLTQTWNPTLKVRTLTTRERARTLMCPVRQEMSLDNVGLHHLNIPNRCLPLDAVTFRPSVRPAWKRARSAASGQGDHWDARGPRGSEKAERWTAAAAAAKEIWAHGRRKRNGASAPGLWVVLMRSTNKWKPDEPQHRREMLTGTLFANPTLLETAISETLKFVWLKTLKLKVESSQMWKLGFFDSHLVLKPYSWLEAVILEA